MLALILAQVVTAASLGISPTASVPLAPVAQDHAPGSCHVRIAANGMQLPDPACTPGAVNPTVTVTILRNPDFRTNIIRDKVTSEEEKRKVYAWYGIDPPSNNTGANQVCELDHVIDISAGGGDSLANIWPECGPDNVPVGQREFKIKDAKAEHVLIRAIKEGATDAQLADLQKRIAADWTQFLGAQ